MRGHVRVTGRLGGLKQGNPARRSCHSPRVRVEVFRGSLGAALDPDVLPFAVTALIDLKLIVRAHRGNAGDLDVVDQPSLRP